MKKLLKVKIKRAQDAGGTHYEYPKEYDPRKFQVLCYETQLTDRLNVVKNRGNNNEYVLGFVEEEFIGGFLKNPDIELLTRVEGEVFIGADLHKSEEKIVNQNKVLLALAKSARGQRLTKKEEDMLDPENKEPGINKTKTLHEVLDENDI